METALEVLRVFTELPAELIYLILAAGAAVENVFPPVPSDTFVLAGALLAARGTASPTIVFASTFLANVATASGMFLVARRYGRAFFKMPIARWLLREHQLHQISGFYGRWGIPAIFVSRFLPAWRALVPVFAGVSGMKAWKVLPPMVLASGLWYGILIYLGAFMGRNLSAIVRIFSNISGVLLWLAIALVAVLAVWWWRTRHHREEDDEG